MPRYAANPEPVQRISSLADFIAYLREELGWPISHETVIDDLTFDWSANDCAWPKAMVPVSRARAARTVRSLPASPGASSCSSSPIPRFTAPPCARSSAASSPRQCSAHALR